MGKEVYYQAYFRSPASFFLASCPRNEEFIDSIRKFAKEVRPSFK